MNRHVSNITQRLSLRAPQHESLVVLAELADRIPLRRTSQPDVGATLARVRERFSWVEDFERDFPSVCFALATGVGKTRLMGAFIAYLHLAKGMRHFFVLAPGLTVYEKLQADFTYGTPKYVFKGLADLQGRTPQVITGETYDSQRTANVVRGDQLGLPSIEQDLQINVFNIGKINSEVRGGALPRVKRLSEYLGEAYFNYLKNLDDLVLIMDESHRYRADAGVKVLNELSPVLGLELTATPQVETPKGPVPFRNVAYSYPLSQAIRDGFVKKPVAATRANFDASQHDDDTMERIKLQDAIVVHENLRTKLEAYAQEMGVATVKPFVLVVAEDVAHATKLEEYIKSPSFHDGYYADKVITVHSKHRGAERDEVVSKLLDVEKPDSSTQVVIHVDMLKEGWDVTNLYVIVPVRPAKSRTLVEQTVGRGLRLPYGRLTGVPELDRLTIIAHDQFDKLIEEANKPDSAIQGGVVIGRDLSEKPLQIVTSVSMAERDLFGASNNAPLPTPPGATAAQGPTQGTLSLPVAPSEPRRQPLTPAELEPGRIALKLVEELSMRPSECPTLEALTGAGARARLSDEVRRRMPTSLLARTDETRAIVESAVAKVTEAVAERNIGIPKIALVPSLHVRSGFHDFKLDVSSIRLQPVAAEILMRHLQNPEVVERMAAARYTGTSPDRLLLTRLADFDDLAYGYSHAVESELMRALVDQAVAHLRSYLADEGEVSDVVQYNLDTLAELIRAQLLQHYWEEPGDYQVTIAQGFVVPRSKPFTLERDQPIRSLWDQIDSRREVPHMVFGNFKRCAREYQRFDVYPELVVARVLDGDTSVLKWLKPVRDDFQITWSRRDDLQSRQDDRYEPDFVAETATEKLIVEVKARNEMEADEVRQKARAAVVWCRHATAHEAQHGGKVWRYALVPHDVIDASTTLAGLIAMYELREVAEGAS